MSHFNGVVLMFRQEPVTLVKLDVLTAQLKCGPRHLDTPPFGSARGCHGRAVCIARGHGRMGLTGFFNYSLVFGGIDRCQISANTIARRRQHHSRLQPRRCARCFHVDNI